MSENGDHACDDNKAERELEDSAPAGCGDGGSRDGPKRECRPGCHGERNEKDGSGAKCKPTAKCDRCGHRAPDNQLSKNCCHRVAQRRNVGLATARRTMRREDARGIEFLPRSNGWFAAMGTVVHDGGREGHLQPRGAARSKSAPLSANRLTVVLDHAWQELITRPVADSADLDNTINC